MARRWVLTLLVTSVAPIPMATMMGKEWGGMGQNYLRSLLALGFQAFLIIVCVAIYAVLVQNIATEDDIIMAIWGTVGYTVLLCFMLFKTGTIAQSIFSALRKGCYMPRRYGPDGLRACGNGKAPEDFTQADVHRLPMAETEAVLQKRELLGGPNAAKTLPSS